ncbi:hypothetical protein E2C01_090415 [Portunus trituberculatus]|uniref:Uncharacterized protein n=1 Tax=Portunus trituberculatus TaxID=210409 RepID=A0A5B7JS61_PORTR|nr:hypothetical protein [Portunus trituberculatus]
MKAQNNVILTTAKDQLAAVDLWDALGGGKVEAFFVYSYVDGHSTNSGFDRVGGARDMNVELASQSVKP